jgi:cytochrome c oxidase cbb3-type subunit 3
MATIDKNAAAGGTGGELETGDNPIPGYFLFLFVGLLIWGVLFIGYFLLSGWSSEGEFEQKMVAHRQQAEGGKPVPGGAAPAAAVDPEKLRAEAEKLYAANCAACHGAAGEGGIGPALKAPQYKYGKEPAAVQASIAKGQPGGMPAFGNQLTAAQVEALANYVTGL